MAHVSRVHKEACGIVVGNFMRPVVACWDRQWSNTHHLSRVRRPHHSSDDRSRPHHDLLSVDGIGTFDLISREAMFVVGIHGG